MDHRRADRGLDVPAPRRAARAHRLIAPHAGAAGEARIVESLEAAIGEAELPPAVEGVAASFSWAVAPQDAVTPAALLECADQRLLYRKRLNRTSY